MASRIFGQQLRRLPIRTDLSSRLSSTLIKPKCLRSLSLVKNSYFLVLLRKSLSTSSRLDEIVQFHLSDIGEGIKEVTVKEWFVQPGDSVAQFDQICEVQSDKASVTITSRFDGVIKKLHYQIDDIAQTGDPLVDIEIQGSNTGSKQIAVEETEAIQVGEEAFGQGGNNSKKVLATPAVRRLASEHSVDLKDVASTGKDGRVLKDDILAFIEEKTNNMRGATKSSQSSTLPPAEKTPAQPTPPAKVATKTVPRPLPVQTEDEVVKFSGFTRAMTKTMTAALQIPHFLYCDEIEMSELTQLRKSLIKESDIKMSYLPFIVKALSIAISDYPMVNSSMDLANEKIVIKASHNIGVAMDTPEGLIVPNIKGVQNLSILEIADELLRLQDLGQRSKLGGTDLKDGTITVSNIGSIGGTYAKPVILPPESVIGAFGRIQTLPRFDENGNVKKAQLMNVSWSADHRVLDGATIARFSNKWKKCLEQPASMLVHLK